MKSEEFSIILHHLLCSVRGLGRTTAFLFEITKTLEFLFESDHLAFYLVTLLAAILSVYYNTNQFLGIHLLQLMLASGTLAGLASALRNKAKIFAAVYALLAVLLLIAGIFAFFYFSDAFDLATTTGSSSSSEQACHSALSCMLSVVTIGLRARGGVGDELEPVSYSDRAAYYGRYTYDLLFYLLVNSAGLSLLGGAVVDGLAALRLEKARIRAAKTARCFVCDLDRGWFDRKVNGFHKHAKLQHKLRHYLAFIYGLKNKPLVACSGIEKAVIEQLIQNDISWMPNSRAKVLEKEGVFTEKSHQADEIAAKLAELHETIAETDV